MPLSLVEVILIYQLKLATQELLGPVVLFYEPLQKLWRRDFFAYSPLLAA